MDSAVVFDLWGPLAVYRKFFTNTSILSYAFPPPTAVKGLVGAFLGMQRIQYGRELRDMQVAVSLCHPVKKLYTTINYVSTKKGNTLLNGERTQIPTEIIKDPYYRIYLRNVPTKHKKQLIELLSNHCSMFTPYLGTSEMIANFKFVGEYSIEDRNSSDPIFINSIVPAETIEPSLLKQYANKLGKERIPLFMDEYKWTLSYIDVAFDMNAKPIPVKGSYSVVDGVNVKFLTKEDAITFRNESA